MPSTFKLLEPLKPTVVDRPFSVRSKGNPAFECVRLLAGSMDIEEKASGKTIKFRHCNLSVSPRRLGSNTIDKLVDLLFDGDLSKSDAATYLTKSNTQNREFWEELRAEICFCLVAQKRGDHVEAFLHFYRILELVSVALPLIYATKFSDFRKSVQFIKSLSKNDRDQDLSILKYFAEEVSNGGSVFSSLEIDFTFDGLDSSVRDHMKTQLDSFVLSDAKILHTWFPTPTDGVSIKFKSIPSFIVSCRNRLFHNALSNENFKLDKMQGAKALCSVLVGPGLHWFALMVSEILKAEASRYV
ncbi:hypothetical protein [uncultured Tateyamaria sp.]|uniref:hypothetical protein n=1 Tax=uncultured Tateyamaria sp. TaxID=455651 RepID=UPI002618A3C9|nr:hypothetical protein [uncultured Tateyamaria sp.]